MRVGFRMWLMSNLEAVLFIAAVALKEGREAWKGDACCTPPLN